jgi:hypothetical protein
MGVGHIQQLTTCVHCAMRLPSQAKRIWRYYLEYSYYQRRVARTPAVASEPFLTADSASLPFASSGPGPLASFASFMDCDVATTTRRDHTGPCFLLPAAPQQLLRPHPTRPTIPRWRFNVIGCLRRYEGALERRFRSCLLCSCVRNLEAATERER